MADERNKDIRQTRDQIVESMKSISELMGETNPSLESKFGFTPGVSMGYEQQMIKEKIDNIDSGIFEVLFTGMFNGGKTTLINAVIGKELLNMSPIPETPAVTKISFGKDKETVKIFYKDGKKEELTIEEYNHTFRLSQNIKVEKIQSIEITQKETFHENLIQLVDSPGLYNTASENSITYDYEPRANAIVFLINGLTPLTLEEQDHIRQKYCQKHPENVFFVVTRLDCIQEEDIGLLEERILLVLKDVFVKSDGGFDEELYCRRVFFVDARGALCAKTGNKKTIQIGTKSIDVDIDYEDTGMGAFEEELMKYLSSDSKYQHAYRDVLWILASCYKKLDKKILDFFEDSQKSLEELYAEKTEKEQRFHKTEQVVKKINEEMNRFILMTENIVQSEYRQFVMGLRVDWDEYFLYNPVRDFSMANALTIVKSGIGEKVSNLTKKQPKEAGVGRNEKVYEAVLPICNAIVTFDEAGRPAGGYIGDRFVEFTEKVNQRLMAYINDENGFAERMENACREVDIDEIKDVFFYGFDMQGGSIYEKAISLEDILELVLKVMIGTVTEAIVENILTILTGLGWVFMFIRTIKAMFGDGSVRDNIATKAIISSKDKICDEFERFETGHMLDGVKGNIQGTTEIFEQKMKEDLKRLEDTIRTLEHGEEAAEKEKERLNQIKKRYAEEFERIALLLGEGHLTEDAIIQYTR